MQSHTADSERGPEGPLRVFISYASKDRKLVKKLARVLSKRMGFHPIWDGDASSDPSLSAERRALIASADVFMPVLTRNARSSARVHQEFGYASGLHMPVLPVAAGAAPKDLAADLRCVVVKKDFSDIEQRLASVDFESLRRSPGRADPDGPQGGPADQPDPSPTATVAAIVHRGHLGDDKILLIRRGIEPFKGKWCLPAGRIERDETARDAVVREIKDKMGLDLDASFLDYFDEILPRYDTHDVVIAFVGPGTGEVTPDGHEVIEVAWHPVLDALNLDLGATCRTVLQAFAEGV